MSLDHPTLDEWFNAYQHRRIWRENSQCYGGFTVDVTALTRDWESRGQRANYPAVLTRAVALTTEEFPSANRLYLKTIWGDRIVRFEGVHITLPLRLDNAGTPVLTAICIRDADRKSASEIREEIRGHVKAGLDGTTITRIVAQKPNTFFWRLALRLLWFLAWRVPMVQRHGGAIGVSCLASADRDWRSMWVCGPTPTSFLISLSAVRREEGRVLLDLGIAANHLVVDGVTIAHFVQALGDRLEASTPEALATLR